ncbi:flagellin hook IN motif family protein, partial [Vibrio parahaemolyticus V-223/04]
TTK